VELRYIVWVIPTIGFIGTVLGISLSLTQLDATHPDLSRVTAALGMAFYTTLVALVESALLVLLFHLVQTREEQAVNDAGR
jgi:biopolymer transport protein ExbB/TolQ